MVIILNKYAFISKFLIIFLNVSVVLNIQNATKDSIWRIIHMFSTCCKYSQLLLFVAIVHFGIYESTESIVRKVLACNAAFYHWSIKKIHDFRHIIFVVLHNILKRLRGLRIVSYRELSLATTIVSYWYLWMLSKR